MRLPEHKCGLYLTHNEHKDMYRTIAQEFEYHPEDYDDMSEEDKAECLATDSLWTLQWYPKTPVGFCVVHAATLEKVINLACGEELEAL